jgi:hypothetical protein
MGSRDACGRPDKRGEIAMLGKKESWLGVLGAGLLVLAGCHGLPGTGWLGGDVAVPTGASFAALAANGRVSYALSVEETSVSVQELLRRVGLPVISVTDDPSTGVVRIKSFAPNNEEFTVVLRSDKSGGKTGVTMEWEKTSAGTKGLKILLELEKIKRPAPAGA